MGKTYKANQDQRYSGKQDKQDKKTQGRQEKAILRRLAQ